MNDDTRGRSADIIRDAAFICGVGMIGGGCWWLYPPAALIVVGGLLLACVVAGHVWRPADTPAERDE